MGSRREHRSVAGVSQEKASRMPNLEQLQSQLRLLEGNQRALVNRVCELEQQGGGDDIPPTRRDTPQARGREVLASSDSQLWELWRTCHTTEEALRAVFDAGQKHALAQLGVEIHEDDGEP